MMEHGYQVRPLSMRRIAAAAEELLQRCAPDHLTGHAALDVADLVDYRLEREGIVVYPVQPEELPDSEAETRPTDTRWIAILMREGFYSALFEPSSSTNRARSTLAHEIGHALLHRDYLRRGHHQPKTLALRRAPRSRLRPFEDSEWQAHAFSGAFLMPRPALRRVPLADTGALAARFGVSESFVRSHLKRIQRAL